ncbi:hypothetical protein AJ80_09762 [Polytolypa hystricis UAMH7299]|uniref:BZIP domain-containing protein n=1 Tax=Polytolypa hystricis (strain UAMH7299) TaxID=1447883 RepID=A0A2B7WJG4_POLH7|nr:hypothetical protein AJ80_09762 [Polytolypa hystricis UAMH7299]
MAPRKRIKKHPLPLSHHTKCSPFHSSSEWVEALTTQQESLNLNLRQSLDTCHGKQEHQAKHRAASDPQKADSNVVNSMVSSRDQSPRPADLPYCPAMSPGGGLHPDGAPVPHETGETKQRNTQDHQISPSPAMIPIEFVDYESASKKADQKRFKGSIASRNYRLRKKEEMRKKVEVSKSAPDSETSLQPPRTSPIPPSPYYCDAPVSETGENKQQSLQGKCSTIHALVDSSPSREKAPRMEEPSSIAVYHSPPSPAAMASDPDLGLALVAVEYEKAKRRHLNKSSSRETKAEMKWSLKGEDGALTYKSGSESSLQRHQNDSDSEPTMPPTPPNSPSSETEMRELKRYAAGLDHIGVGATFINCRSNSLRS